MRRTEALAAAAVSCLLLAGCAAASPDPRCAERAPEVGPPTAPRLAPLGWPDVPDGDAVCGTSLYLQGTYGTHLEVLLVVTDEPLPTALEHYAAAMPIPLSAEIWGEGEEAMLRGTDGRRLSFVIRAAGDGRYAIEFTVTSRPVR